MMKKRVAAVCLSLLMAVQLAAPVSADTAKQQELNQIIEEVNAKNEKLNAPNASLSQYEYQYKGKTPKVTAKDIKLIKEYQENKVKKSITSASAQKEVKWLFRLLRGQYGLYTYYGGDVKFEKAEANILKKLKTYKKAIPMKTYEKIIYNQLKFINDNHFCIGSYTYGAKVSLFGNESAAFTKKDGEYYLNTYPNTSVKSINKKSPESIVKRAIGMDGELTWLPYLMAATADTSQLTIQFADGTSQMITLHQISFKRKSLEIQKDSQNVYAMEEKNGIPMVEMNMMVFQDGGLMEQIRNQFLASIPTLLKAKNAVIDVRNNPGGDGQLVEDWFKAYTGEKLQPNYSTLRIRPGGDWGKYAIKDIKGYDEIMTAMGLSIQGGYYVGMPVKQFIKDNSTRLFLRTSRMSASSAEGFTDAIKNISNTVTVGTNTGGVLTNGANSTFALPYSGLFFQFGECLFYWEESYFKESYGIEPDIWLTGDRENERFEQFLADYAQ